MQRHLIARIAVAHTARRNIGIAQPLERQLTELDPSAEAKLLLGLHDDASLQQDVAACCVLVLHVFEIDTATNLLVVFYTVQPQRIGHCYHYLSLSNGRILYSPPICHYTHDKQHSVGSTHQRTY